MKLSKFLLIAFFATCFCLLYVYQQTEIFRLAYLGKKQQAFQDLLDKNSILRYNIKKQASLVSIGNKISGYTDFQIPDTYRLVKLASAEGSLRAQAQPRNKATMLSRIFSIKEQAEAKTINP
jgi:hypothetical protein